MPSENRGLFQSLISDSSPSEKKIILFLNFLFSATVVQVISIPLLFKEPLFLCTDPNTNLTFSCSESLACTNTYPYIIDKINGPLSFSTEYELICENSSLKRLALTMNFLGFLTAAILQSIFFVDDKKRVKVIGIAGFVLSMGFFLILMNDFLGFSFHFIAWVLFINGNCLVYIITFGYIYASENLASEIGGAVIILLNICWGFFGIIYTVIGYFTNSNWRILIFTACCFSFISSLMIILTEVKKNQEDNEEIDMEPEVQISLISYFRDMWPNKAIRTNFIIYTIVWSFFCMIYNLQYVELESVGGSIYVNTIFCCVLEICSAFFTGALTMRYKCEKVMKFSVLMVSIFFILFIFAPVSLIFATGFESYFFVGCLLISKVCNDIMNLMLYLSLQQMFTDKYVGFFVIFSRLTCRFLVILMPTVNYYLRLLLIHPFFFYGIINLFLRFTLNYCHEIESEGLDTLMNNLNIGIVKRMAITSGSHSMAGSIKIEDVLKNIKVDGVQLSVIRKREKVNDSSKLREGGSNLELPLLYENKTKKNNKENA